MNRSLERNDGLFRSLYVQLPNPNNSAVPSLVFWAPYKDDHVRRVPPNHPPFPKRKIYPHQFISQNPSSIITFCKTTLVSLIIFQQKNLGLWRRSLEIRILKIWLDSSWEYHGDDVMFGIGKGCWVKWGNLCHTCKYLMEVVILRASWKRLLPLFLASKKRFNTLRTGNKFCKAFWIYVIHNVCIVVLPNLEFVPGKLAGRKTQWTTLLVPCELSWIHPNFLQQKEKNFSNVYQCAANLGQRTLEDTAAQVYPNPSENCAY